MTKHKTTVKIDAPLVSVNWSKLWKGLKRLLELILIALIKGLKYLLIGFLFIYKKVRNGIIFIVKKTTKFGKSKQKGWFILVLGLLSIILLNILIMREFKNRKALKNLQHIREVEVNTCIDTCAEEYKKLYDEKNKEIEELKSQQSYITKPRVTLASTELKNIVVKYANQYNVNPQLIECIVQKESSGNPYAENGPYIGLAQYCLPTFLSHRKKMGLPVKDLRTDPEASIQALSWAISQGGGSHGWPNTYPACL